MIAFGPPRFADPRSFQPGNGVWMTPLEPASPHEFRHEPVLLAETMRLLAPRPGQIFVDGTLGGGGHSAALLAAGAQVIGIDQDREALAQASTRLVRFGDQFHAISANFADADAVLDDLGVAQIDGVLLDIGVSSWQIDVAARGFSFQKDGPLDMRMNRDAGLTAADLVNTASAEELEQIFRRFGEEPAARRVAAQLIRVRAQAPILTTLGLAQAVETVLPRRGKTHPATRVFQALRIAVNRELEVLEQALERFSARLAPGGRLAVITFHSLEDRIVKHFFKQRSVPFLDRPEWSAPRRNPACIFNLITPRPRTADADEQQKNPRARSAKLRVAERKSHGE